MWAGSAAGLLMLLLSCPPLRQRHWLVRCCCGAASLQYFATLRSYGRLKPVSRQLDSIHPVTNPSRPVQPRAASRYGLPLSTTHTLVGAVTGVGLLEGRRGFNGMLLVRFFAGWVATLVVAALTAAAFTAQGIYAPNRGLDHQRYNAATYLTSSAWSVAAAGNDTATLAWMQANLPNWNASSADWKPMLNVAQGIQAQQMALLGANVSICGVTPAGSAC